MNGKKAKMIRRIATAHGISYRRAKKLYKERRAQIEQRARVKAREARADE